MALPDPVLVELKRTLDNHYRAELGEPFATAGLCLYRDGRDSVAWHGDRIGRSSTHDTMVAIIVLGAAMPMMRAEAAEADEAVYEVAAGTVDMQGDVLLTQGRNALSSQKLRIDLDAGTGQLEGRVQTIFTPGDTPGQGGGQGAGRSGGNP